MNSVTSHVKSNVIIGFTGNTPWQGLPLKHSVEPGPCHCGRKALYRVRDIGYCREHYDEAVAASKLITNRGEIARSVTPRRRSK